ncbi:uncharacterized protein G2W53_005734 [Senna tora]|uniref:Uncharacterized protein n=1 Tax=Senna tora TaxID=362788 RepID=A0A834X444_9FABA|nr:uncharacterized protein G2W53_005734 [Senna tora]
MAVGMASETKGTTFVGKAVDHLCRPHHPTLKPNMVHLNKNGQLN